MARNYLAMAGSSAATERLFSAAADVCKSSRGGMRLSTIEKSIARAQWLKEGINPGPKWQDVTKWRDTAGGCRAPGELEIRELSNTPTRLSRSRSELSGAHVESNSIAGVQAIGKLIRAELNRVRSAWRVNVSLAEDSDDLDWISPLTHASARVEHV